MRNIVTTAAVAATALALAGCGGGNAARPAAVHKPAAKKDLRVAHQRQAPEVIYMYRVLGDDPTPDSITLGRDGSVVVMRGGGHGDSIFHEVALSRREQRKVLRLARTAPLQMLAHNTIEPGGFGGSDNLMLYMIRRDHKTVGVQQGDVPRPIRPLVHELDLIIEDYVGHIEHSWMQSGAVLD